MIQRYNAADSPIHFAAGVNDPYGLAFDGAHVWVANIFGSLDKLCQRTVLAIPDLPRREVYGCEGRMSAVVGAGADAITSQRVGTGDRTLDDRRVDLQKLRVSSLLSLAPP
jgi:hypothetical protein